MIESCWLDRYVYTQWFTTRQKFKNILTELSMISEEKFLIFQQTLKIKTDLLWKICHITHEAEVALWVDSKISSLSVTGKLILIERYFGLRL